MPCLFAYKKAAPQRGGRLLTIQNLQKIGKEPHCNENRLTFIAESPLCKVAKLRYDLW